MLRQLDDAALQLPTCLSTGSEVRLSTVSTHETDWRRCHCTRRGLAGYVRDVELFKDHAAAGLL
jgi:hypothetical protein